MRTDRTRPVSSLIGNRGTSPLVVMWNGVDREYIQLPRAPTSTSSRILAPRTRTLERISALLWSINETRINRGMRMTAAALAALNSTLRTTVREFVRGCSGGLKDSSRPVSSRQPSSSSLCHFQTQQLDAGQVNNRVPHPAARRATRQLLCARRLAREIESSADFPDDNHSNFLVNSDL